MEILLVGILLIVIIVIIVKQNNKGLEKQYLSSDQSELEKAEQVLKNNGYEVNKKSEGGGCLKTLMGFAIFLALLLLIIFIGDGINNPYSSYEKSSTFKVYTSNDADKLEAYNYAEKWVKDKLKSPSSAKFPDSQRKVEDTKYEYDNTYKINSYVESANSFGVLIKTKFTCTIYFKEGSVYCKDLVLY